MPTSSSHSPILCIVFINASTLSVSGHVGMCAAISLHCPQLLQSESTFLSYLDWKWNVPAMPVTCLHAHIWNNCGTFRNVLWTMCQSNSSNWCANRMFVEWKTSFVSCLCAANLMWSPVSDVIFSLPTKRQIGSIVNLDWHGKASNFCLWIFVYSPSLHAQFSCAGRLSLWNALESSWWATTCLYSLSKVRSPQLTRIVFNVSECLQRVGMRNGSKSWTLPISPRQSE